jgi:histidinol-phosphate aminotransferase
MEILNSIRKDVLSLHYYTAGQLPKSKSKKSFKLASNENLLGSSPKAIRAINDALKKGLSFYPDSAMTTLKESIVNFWKAKGHKFSAKNLLCGDGSGEVLNMLLAAFINKGDTVIMPENSFILYSILSLPKGAVVASVKRKDFRADPDAVLDTVKKAANPKVVIIANPDNPTSTFLLPEELTDFLKKVPPNVAVVMDEAYIHFAGLENSLIGLVSDFPNLIVTHTFAKAYGLAGLRVGYAVMNEKLSEQMEKVRLPFNLGLLQQMGAAAALSDDDFLKLTVTTINKGKAYLQNEFKKLGLWYLQPYANFIFLDLGKKYKETTAYLEENGVSIRMLGSFGFPENYARITIGTKEANEYLVELLKKIIK